MQVTEGDCSEPVPYLLTISQVRLSPTVLTLDSPDEFRPVTPRAVLFCVAAVRPLSCPHLSQSGRAALAHEHMGGFCDAKF